MASHAKHFTTTFIRLVIVLLLVLTDKSAANPNILYIGNETYVEYLGEKYRIEIPKSGGESKSKILSMMGGDIVDSARMTGCMFTLGYYKPKETLFATEGVLSREIPLMEITLHKGYSYYLAINPEVASGYKLAIKREMADNIIKATNLTNSSFFNDVSVLFLIRYTTQNCYYVGVVEAWFPIGRPIRNSTLWNDFFDKQSSYISFTADVADALLKMKYRHQ